MRRLAGIFLGLLLLLPSICLAETKGEVQSIGFGTTFRPNCHIPMLVRVQADKSGTYQIRVVQEDMDRDQQIFAATVSLTGAEEGKSGDQRFWLYFIPQPTEGGLGGLNLRELQQTLKVFLCDEKGKQLVQLPVTQTLINIENQQGGSMPNGRGTRLVLAVSDSTAQPVWHDYQLAMGLLENVEFVPVRSMDLPEDVRGLEAVDAIVWLNAAAPDAAKATDEKRYHALRQYVRAGGHLVICQPPQREATATFDDMMPVTVTAVTPHADLEPLKTIATENLVKRAANRPTGPTGIAPTVGDFLADPDRPLLGPGVSDWDRPKGPFMFARGQLKKDAIIVEQIKWDAEGKDTSPWLARIGYGAGAVSWVAQDLADPSVAGRAKSGWPYVWDRVLDFKHDLFITDQKTTEEQKRPYAQGSLADISHTLLQPMELTSKSRALVSIAVVFFIAYWVVAGPGVYFYLLTKSRPQLSWFMFAFSALVATMLTVLVVKLVVRGAPEIAHVSVVRTAPDEPTICFSRFGLYIPRDGSQEIKLPEVQPKEVSYLTAYPEHPSHGAGEIEFPAQIPYVIPIRDANADEPVAINVPYRSTLKKFQARRVGATGSIGGIQGSPKIKPNESGRADVEGLLTNGTGRKLRNIYIVYHDPVLVDDMILFFPVWEKGQSIDLAVEFTKGAKMVGPVSEAGPLSGYPEQKIKLKDVMGTAGVENGWSRFWYYSDPTLRNPSYGNMFIDDMDRDAPKSFPMMSLFDRLPPMKNVGMRQPDRSELLRRAGRFLNVSPAVAAGRMVVLAEADGPAELPFTLEVEGDKVPGKGKLFYQSILRLEHVGATTMPSTRPTSPAAEAMAFDPAAHVGGKGNLSDEQWEQVQKYRRDEARQRQFDQMRRRRGNQGAPIPAPTPPPRPTQ